MKYYYYVHPFVGSNNDYCCLLIIIKPKRSAVLALTARLCLIIIWLVDTLPLLHNLG